MGCCQLFLHVLFQVRNGLANSRYIFSLVVWNRNIEVLFELHNKFYGVKRVSAKVVGEARFWSNFRFFNTKFLDDDLLYFLCNFRHVFKVYDLKISAKKEI